MLRALTAALALAFALPAAARPPVWTVRDADSEIVLFGSVHVLPEGLDWRSPALTAALRDADDLWFELPIDAASEAEAAQLAVARGLLPAGGSLAALLSADDAQRLARLAPRYGLSPAMIDRMQPWFAEVALAAAAYQAAGARAEQGVERQIAAEAPASAERHAFETARQQIELFADTPRDAQIASLSATLKEMDSDPRAYQHLLDAWMAGDVAGLADEALGPLKAAAPALYARLVTARNTAWTARLRARLAGSGHTVVVVGVGHLVGDDGVPARLKALGYKVTGP